MAARSFTSSGTSRIAFPIGALGFTGAITCAAIVRRTTNAVLHVVSYLGSATSGTNRVQFAVLADNSIQLRVGSSVNSANTCVVADNWCFIAATKAAGSAISRFHKYVYDTNTWSHLAPGAAIGDGTAPGTSAYVGDWSSGGDAFGGDISMCGWYNAAFSDAQIESLPFDLASWFQLPPKALWRLDQPATSHSVPDLSGNGSNQNGIVTTGMGISAVSAPIWTPGQGAMAA